MADTLRSGGARACAATLPASGLTSPSIPALQRLAAHSLTAALTLLDAPQASADQLEQALRKAIRARTHLKRAIRAQEGGAA